MSVNRWCGCVVALCAFLSGICTVSAGQTAGAKIWFAEWEASIPGFSDSDSAVMYILQYNYNFPEAKIDLSAQVGWGDGWKIVDCSTDRTDFLLSATHRFGYFQYGLGYHYINQDQTLSGVTDWNGTYHGPELLLGGIYPLPKGFAVVVSGQYIPVLFWDAEDSLSNSSSDGETDSFGYDLSVRKAFEYWQMAVGYRAQHIEGDIDDASGDGIADDDFSGFYVSAGILLSK